MRLRTVGIVVGVSLLGTTLFASASQAMQSDNSSMASPQAARTPVVARPIARQLTGHTWAAPPTTAQCKAAAGIACYAPFQFQQAYDLKPLYAKGLNGAGRTIIIVDSFGSPTIRQDLVQFDKDFGLPDPPNLNILEPAGKVPPFDPTNATMVGWAEETTLDVEWAHAIAPGANILLLATPVAETEGTVGFPQIVKAENFAIDNNLGDVITQSFGATEETFPSVQSLLDLRGAFVNAQAHHVTVLAASGDDGPTDAKFNGDLFTHQVNSWPSADPLVTSVGGTQLHLDADGNRTAPDNVWNDTALFGGAAASGGGPSHVFDRPSFQNRVHGVVGTHRGTPDVSMSAAVDGGALVYLTIPGTRPGYHIFGGTSEASPLFSGIVAIADQAAGHRLGYLNTRLYHLGGQGAAGIVDVTAGDNTVKFDQAGKTWTINGYPATPGYDMSSGLGTVDAAKLVGELAAK